LKIGLAPGSRTQALLQVALLATAFILLWKFTIATHFGVQALSYPFSLDYGEGIVWQQMRDMVRGTAYRPLQVFPAIVYHYPPVYHLTTAGITWITGLDPLKAGRLVELICTAATGLLIALLTIKGLDREGEKIERLICGTFAALVFLTSFIVSEWAPLMRVDMLSGALGLFGIILTLRAFDRPVWIHAAALAFVLSIYTKQTSIAAPAAAFLVLLIARPRVAIAGITTSTLLGIAALIWLSWATDGGFLRHIFSYNFNRIDTSRVFFLLMPSLFHIPLLICAGFGTAFAWRKIQRSVKFNTTLKKALIHDRQTAVLLIMLIFLALKLPMLAMMLKVGSNSNYLIELLSAVVVFFGLSLEPIVATAIGTRPSALPLSRTLMVCFVIGTPMQAGAMPSPEFHWRNQQARIAAMETIVNRIRCSSKPVISDEMTLIIRAGRDVQWEPAIAAELAHSNVYDEPGFVKMINEKKFGFFAIEWGPKYFLFRERYNPPVADAIAANYPIKQKIGDLTLFLPNEHDFDHPRPYSQLTQSCR